MKSRRLLLLVLGAGLLWTCAASTAEMQTLDAGPAAQMFARTLADLERKRAADPKPNPGNYRLLEVGIEDWLATPEGRFAHSIKIPNPVPEDSGYRPGMTQRQYFEHLCKTEAGEFIFKTADNVEGIFQMRPRREQYTDEEWQHLYAIEDPYGYWAGENDEPGFQFVHPLLYSFYELPAVIYKKNYAWYPRIFDKSFTIPPPPEAKVVRLSGFDGRRMVLMKLEYDTQPRARYGFTWRGIRRPHDRAMGIAGGELIVLDLQTMEVMGVRRGYVIWNGGWTGRVCPRYGYSGGQDKTTYFSAWFLAKVVRPSRWQEYFAIEEKGRTIVGDPNEKRY